MASRMRVSVIVDTTDNRQWLLVTDEKGFYSLKDAPAGQYALSFMMNSTVTKQCVVVTNGNTTTIDSRG
jgi:hypothetical protein